MERPLLADNPNALPSQAFALQSSFFLTFHTGRLDTRLRRARYATAKGNATKPEMQVAEGEVGYGPR
jgi:hypothetical protein